MTAMWSIRKIMLQRNMTDRPIRQIGWASPAGIRLPETDMRAL